MSTQHKYIPSSESHEPKGIESAEPGSVYTADGTGTGNWIFQDEPVTWGNVWQSNTLYKKNTMVVDNLYTMIANKDTYEKPAPVPTGSAESSQPVDPTFLAGQDDSAVYSGHEYTLKKDGWITKVEVKVPEITADTTYRFLTVDRSDPDNPKTNVFVPIDLVADTWSVLTQGQNTVTSGAAFEVLINAVNSSTDTTVTGKWTYTGNSQNAEPAAGDFNNTNQNDLLRISYSDDTATDREADLLTIIPGSVINIVQDNNTVNTQTYDVVNVTNSVGAVHYDVIPTSTGGTGPATLSLCTITATIPTPVATKYYNEVNYNTANPNTWSDVVGLLRLGDTTQTGVGDTAFGVRVTFQEASIASDWDFVAHSI